METSFELNRALEHWRDRMQQSRSIDAEARWELEAHLLESICDLQGTGLSEEEAFWVAVRRLGCPAEMASEFNKIAPWPGIQDATFRSRPFHIVERLLVWTGFGAATGFALPALIGVPGVPFIKPVPLESALVAMQQGIVEQPGWFVVWLIAAAGAATFLWAYLRTQWAKGRCLAFLMAVTSPMAVAMIRYDTSFWTVLTSVPEFVWEAPGGAVWALMGRVDGEFYIDGGSAVVCLGWWFLIWGYLGTREFWDQGRFHIRSLIGRLRRCAVGFLQEAFVRAE